MTSRMSLHPRIGQIFSLKIESNWGKYMCFKKHADMRTAEEQCDAAAGSNAAMG